jgi:hypothetical protein
MKVIQPYKHDCSNCKWVGWVTVGERYGNMYLCQKGKLTEIIIRWSDEPSDYSCYTYHADSTTQPHSIGVQERS